METLTYEKIYAPLYITSKILGIVPFNFENGRLTLSRMKTLQLLINLTICIILTTYYFHNFAQSMYSDFYNTTTIKSAVAIRTFGSFVTMIIILISIYINVKKIALQFEEIVKIDWKMQNFGQKEKIVKINHQHRRCSIILLVVVNLIFNIFGEFYMIWAMDYRNVAKSAIMIYPRLIMGCLNITFCVTTKIIEARFEIINDLVSNKIAESRRVHKYPNSRNFEEDVTSFVLLHRSLLKICKEINSFFSLQLLLGMTFNVLVLIGDAYCIMYMFLFNFYLSRWKLFLGLIKNCITYIFDFVYLSKRSTALCYEANRTKILLLGIKMDIDKEDERNLMILSILKLLQNKLEISACRLFNIDNRFLCSNLIWDMVIIIKIIFVVLVCDLYTVMRFIIVNQGLTFYKLFIGLLKCGLADLFQYYFAKKSAEVDKGVMDRNFLRKIPPNSFRVNRTPLHFMSKILGMAPFESQNGRVTFSKTRSIICLICMTTFTIITIKYFKNFDGTLHREYAKIKTISFLVWLRAFGSIIAMGLILLLKFTAFKKIEDVKKRISQVDIALIAQNREQQISKAGYQNRKFWILLLVVINLCFTIIGQILTVSTKENQRVIYFIIISYPRLVVSTTNIKFYAITIILQERFKIINGILTNKVGQNFCENITHVISLHKLLVKISIEINSIFSSHLLLWITINFLLLVGDLYICMYTIFFNLFAIHYKTVFSLFKNCIVYSFDLFYFSRRSTKLCEEANRAKVALLGIKIDINMEDHRNCVIESILNLMENKLEITAHRLFSIDNALIFSILQKVKLSKSP
ncbi:7tm 7 domain containing protein, partial [Asbolus verrucosus]